MSLVLRHGSLGIIEGTTSFEAYFPSSFDIRPLTSELKVVAALAERSSFPERIHSAWTEVPESDWNTVWKERFVPINVGEKFTILPPWERPACGRISLVIDPGMAFGTGHHETTRSCLLLMERYAGAVAGNRFLDLGTGTGLLAFAARKLGFREVTAVDVDPLAIRAARRNRRLNKLKGLVLREGGLEAARGQFDMIAANLISGTLVELVGEIGRKTAQDGLVIMSGILKGQDGTVAAAARKAGLRMEERLRDGKWVSLICRR